MAKYTKAEQKESLERLQKLLKPGDTIYCILRSVSRSGMSRDISLYFIEGGTPHYLDYSAACVLGYPMSKNSGIKVNGGGMDMGFHLVYSLSSAVFQKGFECIGENCPSNDHRNGDRNYSPHQHSDPGYALNYRWL